MSKTPKSSKNGLPSVKPSLENITHGVAVTLPTCTINVIRDDTYTYVTISKPDRPDFRVAFTNSVAAILGVSLAETPALQDGQVLQYQVDDNNDVSTPLVAPASVPLNSDYEETPIVTRKKAPAKKRKTSRGNLK